MWSVRFGACLYADMDSPRSRADSPDVVSGCVFVLDDGVGSLRHVSRCDLSRRKCVDRPFYEQEDTRRATGSPASGVTTADGNSWTSCCGSIRISFATIIAPTGFCDSSETETANRARLSTHFEYEAVGGEI